MTDPADSFIELMGAISQRDNNPRILGRVFGLMVVEGNGLSLQEIASRLQISKGSASTNARRLRELGLIRLAPQLGDRQDYYELVPQPFQQLTEIACENRKKTAMQIAEAKQLFDKNNTEVLARIQHLEDFYQISAQVLAEITNKLTQSN